MAFPADGLGLPAPHADLPADIKHDYLEAAGIVHRSPRGAAALLRLCVEKLCIHLGTKGPKMSLDDAIGEMVNDGLTEDIQKALDVLRVIGNSAVHAGLIDIKDDKDTALSLFGVLNYVVEDRIARPARLEAMFGKLPGGVLKSIARRNR